MNETAMMVWIAASIVGGSVWAMAADVGQVQAAGARGEDRPTARDLGLRIGILAPGAWNALSDVAGVAVGHATRIEKGVCTGVTAILPHAGNVFQEKVPAAIVVGNGFGKLTGSTQVRELGVLETPIVLTNTLAVFTAADALVDFVLRQPGNESVLSVNPVVGETNDGYLNDIRSRRVRREDVWEALAAARSGPVAEGCVGAGTGTRCLGWKGGIGTASRRLPQSLGGFTVGVLVQTNFDGILTIAGAPVGKELGRHYLREATGNDGGSCMIVVATDAPLVSRQLERLGRRALLGLAAVGSPMTHGSGDYAIAFSTAPAMRQSHAAAAPTQRLEVLRDERLSPYFQAVREATEEAIVNSMLRAKTMTGQQGRHVEAVPIDRLVEICRRYGAISKE